MLNSDTNPQDREDTNDIILTFAKVEFVIEIIVGFIVYIL
jgi:hypothetical protein